MRRKIVPKRKYGFGKALLMKGSRKRKTGGKKKKPISVYVGGLARLLIRTDPRRRITKK